MQVRRPGNLFECDAIHSDAPRLSICVEHGHVGHYARLRFGKTGRAVVRRQSRGVAEFGLRHDDVSLDQPRCEIEADFRVGRKMRGGRAGEAKPGQRRQ